MLSEALSLLAFAAALLVLAAITRAIFDRRPPARDARPTRPGSPAARKP